jgi:hypothetical protein
MNDIESLAILGTFAAAVLWLCSFAAMAYLNSANLRNAQRNEDAAYERGYLDGYTDRGIRQKIQFPSTTKKPNDNNTNTAA